MTQYARFPSLSSGGGITTYANFAAFPATASNGAAAIALDTDNLYIFNSGTSTWKLVAGPAAGSGPAGSTGSVQFNTSGLFAADNSNFFWNSTTHRLGIGTASPTQSLHVVGGITSPGGTHSEKFGEGAVASASENSSFGYQATSTGNNSTSIGSSSATYATTDSVSVGYRAFSNSNQCIALGSNSNATGLGTTVVGYNAHASGANSLSIGSNISTNSGQSSVLVGGNSSNSFFGVTAIGNNVFPQAVEATILGYGVQVTGDYGTAIGAQSYANASQALTIGNLSGNTYARSIVIGNNITSHGTDQMVISVPDFYLNGGSGAGSGTNTIHASDVSTGYTNGTGTSLVLASGLSTGTASGGDVVAQTATPGSAGTTQNTLSDRMRIYGNGGRAVFTGLPDIPATATNAAGSILYADGSFYTGYATASGANRGYKLYSKKLDISSATYYSPTSLVFGPFTDNMSTVQATNPSAAGVGPSYGIGTGSYLADGTTREYNVYAGGTVNGVLVINPTPAYTNNAPSQNVTVGDPTLGSATQVGGGVYTPASTDTYSYNIYAHAVYNGVDIYSTFSAFASVVLDGVTDPYQVVITWTDATFPTGATVTDYTITKQTNGVNDQYVLGVIVGGSFVDNDPALWTNGVPTVSPTSTPDLYKNTVTWTDPTFPVEIDPGSKFIQIARQVAGGGYTQQLGSPIGFGVQTFDDTSDALWSGTPVTTPTTVQNFYKIPITWTAATGVLGYKMLYSPNNFASITTATLPSFATPLQVDNSGSYGPNTDNYTYAITPYQTLNAVRVYAGGPSSNFFNAINNAVPYGVQLDWVSGGFSPYSTGNGYIIQRSINSAGYLDYKDVGNVITYLDDSTGWTTGTPTVTPITGQFFLATDISGGGTAAFTDTGLLPWSDSITVTPTQAASTMITLNPPNAGIDVNGKYKLPAIEAGAANKVLTSGATTGDTMAWTPLSFSSISGTVSNSQLPYAPGTTGGNVLFSNGGTLGTSSLAFDYGLLFHTMRVPTVLGYEQGIQIGPNASAAAWQMYSPSTDFSFYNVSTSGGYGEVMNINAATDEIAFYKGNVSAGTAGKGFKVKEGSNAKMGIATLVAGTVVVSTTAVGTNSRIFLTHQTLGTITVPVGIAVSARTAGTSFTILSGNLTDTSTVAWMIVDPA
jgi:hypothetical protein